MCLDMYTVARQTLARVGDQAAIVAALRQYIWFCIQYTHRMTNYCYVSNTNTTPTLPGIIERPFHFCNFIVRKKQEHKTWGTFGVSVELGGGHRSSLGSRAGLSRCTTGAAGGAGAAPGRWASTAAGSRAGELRSRGGLAGDPPRLQRRSLRPWNTTS